MHVSGCHYRLEYLQSHLWYSNLLLVIIQDLLHWPLSCSVNQPPITDTNQANSSQQPPGKVFDHNSVILPDGHRDCPDGAKCYGTAYVVTFAASLVTLGISIWGILFDRRSAAAAAAAAVAAVTAARDQLVRNHSQTSVSPDENTDGSKKTRRKPSRSPTRSSNEAARVDGPAQLI